MKGNVIIIYVISTSYSSKLEYFGNLSMLSTAASMKLEILLNTVGSAVHADVKLEPAVTESHVKPMDGTMSQTQNYGQ